jgi:hypothetical protein
MQPMSSNQVPSSELVLRGDELTALLGDVATALGWLAQDQEAAGQLGDALMADDAVKAVAVLERALRGHVVLTKANCIVLIHAMYAAVQRHWRTTTRWYTVAPNEGPPDGVLLATTYSDNPLDAVRCAYYAALEGRALVKGVSALEPGLSIVPLRSAHRILW